MSLSPSSLYTQGETSLVIGCSDPVDALSVSSPASSSRMESLSLTVPVCSEIPFPSSHAHLVGGYSFFHPPELPSNAQHRTTPSAILCKPFGSRGKSEALIDEWESHLSFAQSNTMAYVFPPPSSSTCNYGPQVRQIFCQVVFKF